jgi:hypothetical protein
MSDRLQRPQHADSDTASNVRNNGGQGESDEDEVYEDDSDDDDYDEDDDGYNGEWRDGNAAGY